MSRPRHILVIPSWYPDADQPYRGIFFRDQARALAEAGHRVGVLTLPALRPKRALGRVRRPRDLATRVRVATEAGLPTYRAEAWAWFPRGMDRANERLRLRAGLSLFERYRRAEGPPEILHAHACRRGGMLGLALKRRHGLPLVLTEHASTWLEPGTAAEAASDCAAVLRGADRCLAVSPQLRDAIRQQIPGLAIEVLGNLVDEDFFRPVDENFLRPVDENSTLPAPTDASRGAPEPFRFLAIAALRPLKGLDLLLDAFALAFGAAPEVHLEIGGDGEERAALEARAAALGLGERVAFLGRLERPAVLAALQRCQVLVSTSRVETFGLTLAEAMACGRPVLATRSGGPEFLVGEGDGILVPVGDRPALAAALARMRADYADYDPQAIRARCVARFGKRAVTGRLAAIYAEILDG